MLFQRCDVTVVGDSRGCAAGGKRRRSFPKPSRAQLKAVLKVFPGFCIPIRHQGRWEEAGNPEPALCPQSCDLRHARHDTSGLDGADFRGGLPKDGPLLARKTNFRIGVWEVFWKMASKLATAPKLTQPCVRNKRKELVASCPSLGLWDRESLFLCSPGLGWLCCGRRRHSQLSSILEIA